MKSTHVGGLCGKWAFIGRRSWHLLEEILQISCDSLRNFLTEIFFMPLLRHYQ